MPGWEVEGMTRPRPGLGPEIQMGNKGSASFCPCYLVSDSLPVATGRHAMLGLTLARL